MAFQLKTAYHKSLADLSTPVSIYLNIRDIFSESILLESTDFQNRQNCFSYVCVNPIASFEIKNNQLYLYLPSGEQTRELSPEDSVIDLLQDFIDSFGTDPSLEPFSFATNGIFGYTAFEAVKYFENINLQQKAEAEIPDMVYRVYQNIIVIDHFKSEMYLFEHQVVGIEQESFFERIQSLLQKRTAPVYPFQTTSEEKSNLSNEQFMDLVSKGKAHCQRGDVFQVVFSRRFSVAFSGDDFNVYRRLRAVNPSPYLFYFDYGNFQLMGSSPEAQLEIKEGKATIHPIAGTFKRTGQDEIDLAAAKALSEDPKENAEHVMLVDLARNDLSRHCEQVSVETYQEIQFFSHVIHLVSKVSGLMDKPDLIAHIMADTFPAGTLSGAPKHRALQLISDYEPTPRGYYGGAVGYIGFDGSFNHAIMIRSFLSKNNILHYQAGAGIVSKSDEQSELQEVNNKLAALKTAIKSAT